MEVRLSRKAHKILKTLDRSIRSRIVERLLELEENPYPGDGIKVHGMEGVYRIGVGDYRVLYEVRRKEGVILVVKIEHRKHAY